MGRLSTTECTYLPTYPWGGRDVLPVATAMVHAWSAASAT